MLGLTCDHLVPLLDWTVGGVHPARRDSLLPLAELLGELVDPFALEGKDLLERLGPPAAGLGFGRVLPGTGRVGVRVACRGWLRDEGKGGEISGSCEGRVACVYVNDYLLREWWQCHGWFVSVFE